MQNKLHELFEVKTQLLDLVAVNLIGVFSTKV